jgi:hypothetical protein
LGVKLFVFGVATGHGKFRTKAAAMFIRAKNAAP